MKRKIRIIEIIFFILIILMTGCEKEMKEEKITLNDRQIKILDEMELSTNVDELNNRQIAVIKRIEEILQYLERKYDEKFEYVGYVEKSELENEYLLAVPEGGNKNTDTFRVECDNDEFYDEYLEQLLRPIYEKKMCKCLSDIIESTDLKIYSTIYETDIIKTDFSEEDITKNTKSSTMIFLSNENLNIKEYDGLYEKVKSALMKNQFSGNVQLLIYKKEYFNRLNREIYNTFLDDNYYIYRKNINL